VAEHSGKAERRMARIMTAEDGLQLLGSLLTSHCLCQYSDEGKKLCIPSE
jgi:hypothetical protein